MAGRERVETKSERLEVRMRPSERELVDIAAAESGGDISSFVVSSLVDASKRVLADRDHFILSRDGMKAWDAINRRPARELAGLRDLMQRPSPFID